MIWHDVQMALGFLRGDGSGIDPNGNLVSATAGRGLRIRGGANARLVRGVLAAGTAVVANTSVTAATRVFVTHEGDGGAVGFLHSDPAANVPGVSFTVVSSNGADVGHFWALLVEVL